MANPIFPQEANSVNENNLLKDWYTHDRIRDLVYPTVPFTMMLRMDMSVSGRQYVAPQIFSDPQGTSDTFSVAQGNQFPLTAATFIQQPLQKYTLGSITGRLMRQTRNEEGGFLNMTKESIDKSLKTHVNRLHCDLTANDGTGALAEIASVTPVVLAPYTNVVQIQLSIPEQVRYFELRLSVTMAANKVAPYGATDVGSVVAIARTPGIITVALNAPFAGPVNWLGVDGDFVTNDPSNGAQPWQGLPAWLPTVASRSAGVLVPLFNGVDRTQDSDRLAGVALDLTGSPVKSALIRLASAISANGGSPDTSFMHQFDFAALAESLGPNVLYDNIVLSKEANISYRSIVLQTESGEVRIVQDAAIPRGTLYMLEMDSWKLACWGDFANIIQDDGLTVLRNSAD